LKEEKFYWPEFIKFKAFYVEQKWTKEERAIFVLYVVNPLSEDFIALKNIQSAFAELIKTKPKQMSKFLSCVKNENYLDDLGRTPEHLFYEIILKEAHVSLNDIISSLISL
jgi:hypothetical protein